MHSLVVLFLLASVLSTAKSSKILGVFPSPGYSQFILCEKLMTELARRGHEVTVISVYKPKYEVKNYKTILVDGLIKNGKENMFLLEDECVFRSIAWFYKFTCKATEFILSQEEVQNLIHSNETFDMVLVEQFGNEAHMGFAQHFNAPLVVFTSLGLSEWNSHLVGNIRLPSVEPLLLSHYSNHMTFFQRLINSIVDLFDILYKKLVVSPQQQQYVDKYFPQKYRLEDIMYNASLLLLNSHASTTHPTALTTAAVEIGGFHISSKKLPEDVQKFLDEAKDGAIFFSMGSNLHSADLPNETMEAILSVFSKLKQRVLWKFEKNIPNKPRNLLISKWLPQSDILAHPNTVAFITHGGLLSTTEAIFYGVPMLGIPVFGDQKMNVVKSVQKGIAIHLPFKKLAEDTLHKALKDILENPKYRIQSKKYSTILRDQPVNPLDLAMYWIDYVLRHNGASHLRNSSLELYWFQLYLIDIIIFVLSSIIIAYYFVKLLVKKFVKSQNSSKETTVASEKQKIN